MPHSLYTESELEKGLELVSRLMDTGAIEAIDDERLKALVTEGLVGTICPDGDHSLDIFSHTSRFTRRLHLPGLNGGAILLAPTNPCFAFEGQSVMLSIKEGWELGKGSALGLFSHFPCGRAKKIGYELHQVIHDTLAAKAYVVEMLQVDSRLVLPFLHVDWTPQQIVAEKERRTYILRSCCNRILQKDGSIRVQVNV